MICTFDFLHDHVGPTHNLKGNKDKTLKALQFVKVRCNKLNKDVYSFKRGSLFLMNILFMHLKIYNFKKNEV